MTPPKLHNLTLGKVIYRLGLTPDGNLLVKDYDLESENIMMILTGEWYATWPVLLEIEKQLKSTSRTDHDLAALILDFNVQRRLGANKGSLWEVPPITNSATLTYFAFSKVERWNNWAATQRQTPARAINHLIETGSHEILKTLASRSLTPSQARLIYNSGSLEAINKLLTSPNLPPHMYWEGWKEYPRFFHKFDDVIRNPSLPPDLAEEIYRDPTHVIAIISNPSLPVSILRKEAYSLEWENRREVARNPAAPLKLLEHLSHDAQPAVRVAVAKNPSSSAEILEHLSHDDDLRELVAWNPNTSVSTLIDMCQSPSFNLACKLAENPNLPAEQLKILAFTPKPGPPYRAAYDRHRLASTLARNPNTPESTLRFLYGQSVSDGQYDRIFHGLASHLNTPVDILKNLFQQEKYRQDVLDNPSYASVEEFVL